MPPALPLPVRSVIATFSWRWVSRRFHDHSEGRSQTLACLSGEMSLSTSPQAVFDAINNVCAWWSEAEEGDTDKLGAGFYHHYQDVPPG